MYVILNFTKLCNNFTAILVKMYKSKDKTAIQIRIRSPPKRFVKYSGIVFTSAAM